MKVLTMTIQDLAQTVQAVTALATLAFMVFSWIMIRKAALKVNDIHDKTAELVEHTNGLTDLLMEKTDIAARAEGVKEGIAQQRSQGGVDEHAGLLAKEAAEAAARIIQSATEHATIILNTIAKSTVEATTEDRLTKDTNTDHK